VRLKTLTIMDEISIDVFGLTKRFGSLLAVDSVSFRVSTGIFGLLGPNGAGKSTIVLMLTTLLKPTKGTAYVCGYSIIMEPIKVRECISYVPQDLAVDDKLTGRENVLLYARLYGVPSPRDKVDEVLALVDLQDRADSLVYAYSGGMKRRLELAQAMVHEPRVLFFDEPTVGLDVASRGRIWERLRVLARDGATVFVTTHYMEEADEFCDRVAIIDHGTIKAIDTPSNLKSGISRSVVTVRVMNPDTFIPDAYEHMDGIRLLGAHGQDICFLADSGEEAIPLLSELLRRNGIRVSSFSVDQPTLNDVFLKSVDSTEGEWSRDDSKRFKRIVRRRK
jgi:ABC-2 type transport system ATP-binding protein